MHVMKEERKTVEVFCQKTGQTVAENDVIVPDSKPDIKKILEANGSVCLTEKQIQSDQILLQGVLRISVLYLPDDTSMGGLCSLSVTREFSYTMDCRGITSDMPFMAQVSMEAPDYTLLNSRKLNLRCVLGFQVKVMRPLLLSLATGVEDADSLELQTERLRLMAPPETCDARIILRDQLEFPSGKPTMGEILRLTLIPTATDLQLLDGKAVAKGQVRICTLYRSEQDSSPQFMEHLLPFTEILDMPGAVQDMEGEIDLGVADLFYEIQEDSDGEARILRLETVLTATVCSHEILEVPAITDGYSLSEELNLTTKTYAMERLLDRSTANLSHKDHVELPPLSPPMEQICDVQATAKINQITRDADQITVVGTIRSHILYLTKDESVPLAGFYHQSEFSHSFSVPGADRDTACDARIHLEHTSYTLSGTSALELRFVLGLAVQSVQTGEISLVDDISFSDGVSPLCPCLVLYLVQPGDTLWGIAKTYHTSVEDLKNLNHLEQDTIYPGQSLKILARCAA